MRLAWVSSVDLVCTGWSVSTFLGLCWERYFTSFAMVDPLVGTQLKGHQSSRKVFNWDPQFSQTHLPQTRVENPNQVNKNKNTHQKPVLGTILCSSSDTNGKSEPYTENVPTTRESISLIWPGPKYSHSFFCCCSKYTQWNLWLEEMVVGNQAESTGNNDNGTQVAPRAFKWLQMPLTNGCQSKDTCNTHARSSAALVPLNESGLLGGKRRNYTPWV